MLTARYKYSGRFESPFLDALYIGPEERAFISVGGKPEEEYCLGDDIFEIAEMFSSPRPVYVIGDKDADGVTSLAVVNEYFPGSILVVPNPRFGRGLTEEIVNWVPPKSKVLTVDNGIHSVDEVRALMAKGCHVVITDHHAPPDVLPDCTIIHPEFSGCRFKGLSGAGLIYMIMSDLFGENEMALQFATIGTIADVVPIRWWNRWLVGRGIASMQRGAHPAIYALCNSSGVYCKKITSTDVAWRIAPLINAACRAGDSDAAVSLLTSSNLDVAKERVKVLAEHKQDQRDSKDAIIEDLSDGEETIVGSMTFVLSETRSIRVSGAVISTISGGDPYCVGVVDDDMIHASIRCPEWYNASEFIDLISDLTISGGGHVGAAGFTCPVNNWEKIIDIARSYVPLDDSGDRYDADFEIKPEDAAGLIGSIKSLEPYGKDFEAPVFLSTVKIANHKWVGGDMNHLSFTADGVRSIFFADEVFSDYDFEAEGKTAKIAYTVTENYFRGRTNTQFIVEGAEIL